MLFYFLSLLAKMKCMIFGVYYRTYKVFTYSTSMCT